MRRMSLLDGDLRGRWGKKPKALNEKQALAAIGQGHLIALWDSLFSRLNQPIAQILLTRGDLADVSPLTKPILSTRQQPPNNTIA